MTPAVTLCWRCPRPECRRLAGTAWEVVAVHIDIAAAAFQFRFTRFEARPYALPSALRYWLPSRSPEVTILQVARHHWLPVARRYPHGTAVRHRRHRPEA